VNVPHEYLGPGVEVRLWNPLDDVEARYVAPAAHTDDVNKTSNDTPVVSYARKSSANPVSPTEPLPDGDRNDEGKSPYSEKKPPVFDRQSQTGVPAMPTCSEPRQQASSMTSSAEDGCSKRLPITANSDAEFCLLKRILDGGCARKHNCSFSLDQENCTVTLTGRHADVLAGELYECKKNGTFEDEVCTSERLARTLYGNNREWLCDSLRRKVNDAAVLIMSQNRLVVVAFCQQTASDGAERLKACLLHGRVPLTDGHQKTASSAKFRKKLDEIVKNKAVEEKVGVCEITVDGLPRDVIHAVTEIDLYLHK